MYDAAPFTDDATNRAGISDIAGLLNAIKRVGGKIVRSLPPHMFAELARQGQLHRSKIRNDVYENILRTQQWLQNLYPTLSRFIADEQTSGHVTRNNIPVTAAALFDLSHDLRDHNRYENSKMKAQGLVQNGFDFNGDTANLNRAPALEIDEAA